MAESLWLGVVLGTTHDGAVTITGKTMGHGSKKDPSRARGGPRISSLHVHPKYGPTIHNIDSSPHEAWVNTF